MTDNAELFLTSRITVFTNKPYNSNSHQVTDTTDTVADIPSQTCLVLLVSLIFY
jgi:hypothetical protein